MMRSVVLLILLGTLLTRAESDDQISPPSPDRCKPVIIGHRGASGYVPEHTLASYALAVFMGADYIEPDLVMTKDGQLISRHDNELGLTTNVSEKPQFADRNRNQTIDGNEVSGWFTEDFTLEEIKSLRTKERIPDIRPGNTRLDGAFVIPTFQEIIDLVKSLENSQRRIIGIYPEIKHSTHFKRLGLSMEQPVVNILNQNGYTGPESPAYIQSFEISNLKELKNMTRVRLLQLYDKQSMQPFDQVELGTGLTYGDMATLDGLKEVAKYAYAVGPDKNYVIPVTENNTLGEPTRFVSDAHMVGLKVHVYTFRAENEFLPNEYRSSNSSTAFGNLTDLIKAYLTTGIDGLFSDHPDIPVRLRGSCTSVI